MGEEKEMLDPNVVGRSMPQCCRCYELEERCKKAEVRCEELGLSFFILGFRVNFFILGVRVKFFM